MNQELKNQIKDQLRADYQLFDSLANLENATGVSKTYLSQILNNKADPADGTWNKLANHYKLSLNDYVVVDTENLKKSQQVFQLAAYQKAMYAIIGGAGTGKSTSGRKWSREKENVYYLECRNYSQKRFLEELAKVMNVQCSGTNSDFVDAIRRKLSERKNPLLILDEASQLNDNCLIRIKEIYGDYHSAKAGIVLLGVDYLETNLVKNARKDKRGFVELLDRIQNPIIHLDRATEKEVLKICQSNNVTSPQWLKMAVQQATKTGSFRAVETAITTQTIENY